MSWIPDWAKTYVIEKAASNGGVVVTFSRDEWKGKPISELPKDLAISDVCQQIRERNCNTIPLNGEVGSKLSKYHREIKPGVWIDIYDILRAYGIKCHALAHAIKKLLMPGNRGHKDYNQDCEEAIQSIRRSIDEHV